MRAAREREAEFFKRTVDAACQSPAFLQAHLAVLTTRVQIALSTITVSLFSALFAALLFVPGVRERGGAYLTITDTSPETYIVISGVMSAAAVGMHVLAIRAIMKFTRAIRSREIEHISLASATQEDD